MGAEVYTPDAPREIAGADGIDRAGRRPLRRDRGARRAVARGDPARTSTRPAPLLGICLGLQWLFEGSTEAPDLPGLGLLPGRCGRLRPEWDRRAAQRDGWAEFKVPHVGWNTREPDAAVGGCCRRRAGAQAYFTHSYAAPVGEATVATTTTRPNTFASVGRARPRLRRCSSIPRSRATPACDAAQLLRRHCRSDASGRRGARPGCRARCCAKRIIACLDVRDGRSSRA